MGVNLLLKLQGIVITLLWICIFVFLLIFCIAAIYLNLFAEGGENDRRD